MYKLALLLLVGLAIATGCQTNSQYGTSYPQQSYGYQPGYEQTFPPQVQSQPQGQFGNKAGRFLGDMAGGFARSVAGGAGFTAGRDLWNTIVN